MRTKYLLLTLGAASALAISSSANAAHVVVTDSTFEEFLIPNEGTDFTTITFEDNDLAANFEETLTFTNSLAGLYFFNVSTSTPNVDFTRVFVSDASGVLFNLNGNNGVQEFFSISNMALDAGKYTLNVNGVNRGTAGALAGSITIGQAVPEPGTWAMMLLGFGAIGFAMRRRKDSEGTKRIRVAYS